MGAGLGVALPFLDDSTFAAGLRRQGWLMALIASSPSGARAILQTSAGALSTVLGVVFSITVVTLQLAATQYSSRILRRFMADRVTQVLLGTFIGTVIYLLMVLRVIRDADGDEGFTAPVLSLGLALLLVAVCLFLVAVLVHHVIVSIQAATLVSEIGRETIGLVERLPLAPSPEVRPPPHPPVQIPAIHEGYVQIVDERRLCQALAGAGRLVRVEVAAGDFVIRGTPLVSIWPARSIPAVTASGVRGALRIGRERTTQQDLLYGVRQLVDVALKGLSPSVNEVTTAVLVVNELGAVVRAFLDGGAGIGQGLRRVEHHGLALLVPVVGLEPLLHHAFREISLAAGDQPRVVARILEVLAAAMRGARHADQRAALRRAGHAVCDLGGRRGLADADRAALEARLGWLDDRSLGLEPERPAPQVH